MKSKSALSFILSLHLSLVGLGGCAHYGFADRDAHDEGSQGSSPRQVAVTTLTGDAYQGLDLGDLTGHFVDMLRREGIDQARWNGGQKLDVIVQCQIADARVMGYGRHLSASSSVRCTLSEGGVPFDQLEASATVTSASTQIMEVHRSLEEEAVLDALSRLSPRVAQKITALSPHPPGGVTMSTHHE